MIRIRGNTARYGYNVRGELIAATNTAPVARYAYNPWNGLVSAVTNGVGLVAEYQYDVMDRPTNIVWRAPGGGVLASFRYAYNALGMITDRARSVGTNEVATAYGYDDLDRLASETESTGVSRTYGYDLAGNRLFKTETGSATTAYSLGVGNRLATYTGGSYTHNAAGCATSIDRTGKPDLDLTWNGQYQVTSVSTNGVVAESYVYDPLGRRASTTSGGVTIRHVYDGVHCAADIDSAGAVVRSYTRGPGIDNLLAVTCHSGSSSTTYYALTDIQGTVHGFADAGGNLVARYAYDAWGNLTAADVAVSDLADNRYLFQGREYSHATGLYNFRLRWYDPATGRWISKDPIGISGGLNLYAFCGNDPVNYMDPMGLAQHLVSVDDRGDGRYGPDIDWGDNPLGGGRRSPFPPLPPTPLDWALKARRAGEEYGWPYAHVLANAGITSDYGRLVAYFFSMGKEFVDLAKGVCGNEDSLYSAFQSLDFEMNRIGRSIPDGVEPEEWAAPYKNYPEGPPGPFYRD